MDVFLLMFSCSVIMVLLKLDSSKASAHVSIYLFKHVSFTVCVRAAVQCVSNSADDSVSQQLKIKIGHYSNGACI